MSSTALPRIVGVAEAAQRLGVSRRTVVRAIHDGRIEATKTGPGTAGFVIAEAEVARLVNEGARHE